MWVRKTTLTKALLESGITANVTGVTSVRTMLTGKLSNDELCPPLASPLISLIPVVEFIAAAEASDK
ncbi:hypothetical protein WAX78_03045 [Bacillus sp. FJAT-53711]|uniref:Uncharacterized protein n=1 Tax=Bacillus yunxiaonensis TaxID=3127665 RepID=A0ABU8FR23_9BACI